MTPPRLAPLLAAPLLALQLVALGCQTPCESNEACGARAFCGDGFCKSDCALDGDCESGRSCQGGQCLVGFVPVVRITSPAVDALVDETFTLEATVEFRGPVATATLVPETGESCVPVFDQSQVVESGGDTRTVVFEGVPARGGRFSYRLVVDAGGIPSETSLSLRGPALTDTVLGALVLEPGRSVDGARPVAEVSVSYTDLQPEVIAFTEPVFGPPTVRRVVANDVLDLDEVRVPLARGRQIIWLESPIGTTLRRCGIAVEATNTEAELTEIALAFEGEEAADLDLVVVAELDDGDGYSCSAKSPGRCAATEDRGLRTATDEGVSFSRASGVYGIAVLPAAVTGAPLAWIRVNDAGAHIDFVGPVRVQAESGQTWLAARVWITGDSVFVEPLDRMSDGVPSGSPTSW